MALERFPDLTCRKCGTCNPTVYLAPVSVGAKGACICLPCARSRGWLDHDDDLKPGVKL